MGKFTDWSRVNVWFERRLNIQALSAGPPLLVAEGDELTCPRAHGIVRGCVGRDSVVAETDSQVTLCVELEPGELLVGADFVDEGGVGMQVHRVHAEH